MGYDTDFRGCLTFNKQPDKELIDYVYHIECHENELPPQPKSECQWVIEEFGGKYVLTWDGQEKFYYYVDWMRYLIDNIFSPKGYVLNGEIEWRGEDWDDTGTIEVENNMMIVSER